MGGQEHAPAALSPGKTWYQLCRTLDGLRGRTGRHRKSPSAIGIRSPDRPDHAESLSLYIYYIPFIAMRSAKHNNYFTFPYLCVKQRQEVWLSCRAA